MIIIQLSYKVDLQVLDGYLSAHRAFLDTLYQQGILIASGPLVPRTGGIIIAAGDDISALKVIFNQDPYAIAGVADYHFMCFNPVKYCKELQGLIERTQESAC